MAKPVQKSCRAIEWYCLITQLKYCVEGSKNHRWLINMLDFRNKSQIAVAVLSVGFLKVKPKVNKKSGNFIAYLFAFRWILNTKTWNTQFKIWNTQLSQKDVGKYPIASNPYLELCFTHVRLTYPYQPVWKIENEQLHAGCTLAARRSVTDCKNATLTSLYIF